MQRFANPLRFLKIATAATPWAVAATALLLVVGLYQSLFLSPADYQQGDAARIMYVHVPAAWMGMFVYAFMVGASVTAFIWRHPLADVAAKAAAPIGAAFTGLALLTGSLWGKPMWGTWWVWDARLTSVLILFFLYIGYITLWSAIEDPIRAARAARILSLVGGINIPIIHFSVEWWNTLHQGASVFRSDGPSMPASMLVPLLTMALAYHLLFLSVLLVRMRTEILERRLRTLRSGVEEVPA